MCVVCGWDINVVLWCLAVQCGQCRGSVCSVHGEYVWCVSDICAVCVAFISVVCVSCVRDIRVGLVGGMGVLCVQCVSRIHVLCV